MLSLAVFYYGKAKPGIPLRSRQWDFRKMSGGFTGWTNMRAIAGRRTGGIRQTRRDGGAERIRLLFSTIR